MAAFLFAAANISAQDLGSCNKLFGGAKKKAPAATSAKKAPAKANAPAAKAKPKPTLAKKNVTAKKKVTAKKTPAADKGNAYNRAKRLKPKEWRAIYGLGNLSKAIKSAFWLEFLLQTVGNY